MYGQRGTFQRGGKRLDRLHMEREDTVEAPLADVGERLDRSPERGLGGRIGTGVRSSGGGWRREGSTAVVQPGLGRRVERERLAQALYVVEKPGVA